MSERDWLPNILMKKSNKHIQMYNAILQTLLINRLLEIITKVNNVISAKALEVAE